MIGSRLILGVALGVLATGSCLDAQLNSSERPSLDFSGKASNGTELKMTAGCMGDVSGNWFLDMKYVSPKSSAHWLAKPQRVLIGAPIQHGRQTPIYRTDYCPHADLTVNGDLSKNDDLTSALCNTENFARFTFNEDYGKAIFKSSKTEFGIHLSDQQYTKVTIHPQSLQLTGLINTCEKLTDQAREYDRTHPVIGSALFKMFADALNSPSRPSGAASSNPPSSPPAPVGTKPIQPQPNAATVNPLTSAMNTVPSNLATLTVNNTFQSPNPLAGMNFYLMRDDFATTMNKNGYSVPAGAEPKTVFAKACGRPGQRPKCDQMFEASKANAAVMQRADLRGTAVMGPVQPGDYYLLIYSYGPGRPALYWDEEVTLNPGTNAFTAGPENSKPLR
jgi:hypothetical protein